MSIFNLKYIYESTNNISYSNSFDDVKNIVDSLTHEELLHICNGNFKNSPYVKYRKVALVDKDPAAFIDAYSIPSQMEKDEVAIVCACKKKYRGLGLIKTCYNGLENELYNKGIRKIYWETQKSNIASASIARSLGYSKGEDVNKDDDNYVKILGKGK